MKRCVLLMWVLLALAGDFGAPFALREGGAPSAIRTADANEVRSRPSERPDRARESERKAGDVRANRTEASEARPGSFRAQRQLPEAFKRSDLYKWEYGEFDGRTLRNSVPDRPDLDTIRDHLRKRAQLDVVDGERRTVSMYTDLPTAERATAETLRQNKAAIENWLKQREAEQRSFTASFEKSVGVVMELETGNFSNASSSTVLVRRTADGRYSVVESFPERRSSEAETITNRSNTHNIARFDLNSLPAADRVAVLDTLRHIDNGTKPSGKLAVKWSTPFENRDGDLPGERFSNSPYVEYRVAPSTGTRGAGTNRIVRNTMTGEMYFTWTHYGDTGSPAFVQIR